MSKAVKRYLDADDLSRKMGWYSMTGPLLAPSPEAIAQFRERYVAWRELSLFERWLALQSRCRLQVMI
jgi:hypothetical protein